MTTYLANIVLTHYGYPDTRHQEEVTRIVVAADWNEAHDKIEAAFARDDPYGHSVVVTGIDLNEAIT